MINYKIILSKIGLIVKKIIIFSSILLVSFFLFINSNYGKFWLKEKIEGYFKEQSLSLNIQNIRGVLPFSFSTDSLSLTSNNKLILKVKDFSVSWQPLKLFLGVFVITRVSSKEFIYNHILKNKIATGKKINQLSFLPEIIHEIDFKKVSIYINGILSWKSSLFGNIRFVYDKIKGNFKSQIEQIRGIDTKGILGFSFDGPLHRITSNILLQDKDKKILEVESIVSYFDSKIMCNSTINGEINSFIKEIQEGALNSSLQGQYDIQKNLFNFSIQNKIKNLQIKELAEFNSQSLINLKFEGSFNGDKWIFKNINFKNSDLDVLGSIEYIAEGKQSADFNFKFTKEGRFSKFLQGLDSWRTNILIDAKRNITLNVLSGNRLDINVEVDSELNTGSYKILANKVQFYWLQKFLLDLNVKGKFHKELSRWEIEWNNKGRIQWGGFFVKNSQGKISVLHQDGQYDIKIFEEEKSKRTFNAFLHYLPLKKQFSCSFLRFEQGKNKFESAWVFDFDKMTINDAFFKGIILSKDFYDLPSFDKLDLDLKMFWSKEKGQIAKGSIGIGRFQYKNFQSTNSYINIDVESLLEKPQGSLEIIFQDSSVEGIPLGQTSISIMGEKTKSEGMLRLFSKEQSEWNIPFTLSNADSVWEISIVGSKGKFLKKTVELEPFKISFFPVKSKFEIMDCRIKWEKMIWDIKFHVLSNKINFQSKVKNFPLKLGLASENPFYSHVIDADLEIRGTLLNPQLNMQYKMFSPHNGGLYLDGKLGYRGEACAGILDLKEKENITSIVFNIPSKISLFPFSWNFNIKKSSFNVKGDLKLSSFSSLFYDGVFVDGLLKSNFKIQNKKLSGQLSYNDGRVLAYGVNLSPIDMVITAKDKKIVIEGSVRNTEDNIIIINGSGENVLEGTRSLDLDIIFRKFKFFAKDKLRTDVEGNLKFKLLEEKRELVGNLIFENSDINVDTFLYDYIPVVPLYNKNKKVKEDFSLDLRLSLQAKNLKFHGSGLSAFCSLDLNLFGNFIKPKLQGQLKLKEGSIMFLHHSIILDRGYIHFYKAGNHELDILGKIYDQELVVDVHALGLLDTPSLQFKSEPALSGQAILARIIFGVKGNEAELLSDSNGGYYDYEILKKMFHEQNTKKVRGQNLFFDSMSLASPSDEGENAQVVLSKKLSDRVILLFYPGISGSKTILRVHLAKKIFGEVNLNMGLLGLLWSSGRF